MVAVAVAGRGERVDSATGQIVAVAVALVSGGGIAGIVAAVAGWRKPRAEAQATEAGIFRADVEAITAEYRNVLERVTATADADRARVAVELAEVRQQNVALAAAHEDCTTNLAAVNARLSAAERRLTELGG